MFIDSHAHIYSEKFEDDIDQVIENAASANVDKICMPNIDESSISRMHTMQKQYPEMCFSMMGLHPCSVKENYEEQLQVIEEYLGDGDDYIAVGEIGIDLYWDKSLKEQQIEAFKTQVKWAEERNMAIVIHCRNSMDLVIEILEEMNIPSLKGVFHCFTGKKEQSDRILDLGFFIGLGGILTFKNSQLEKEIESINMSRIILETDSPYLSPEPHRGKRNEPAYVKHVAEKLAEVKNMDIEKIGKITSENVMKLYDWE